MLNKEQWIKLMEATGLDDAAMRKFHQQFEAMSGNDHQEFLEILGINKEEIRKIRSFAD